MINKLLPWLEATALQLGHYIEQDRIPQALLIVGTKGLGKLLLAENYSRSLLCMDLQVNHSACGQCSACLLFEANTHPDYTLIQPEEKGKVIGVDVIRGLTEKLSLKPHFQQYRIVIITPAEALNNAASNAFLKYLEEPTERTCLILITEKPSHLSATLRSRCQTIFVPMPESNCVSQWLTQQGIIKNQTLLLKLSRNAPLLARQLATDELILELRVHCFEQWIELSRSNENLLNYAEQWSKFDKDILELLIVWLISYLEDMIKLAHDERCSLLVNSDCISALQTCVNSLNLRAVYDYYDVLLQSQKRFDSSLNKQLLLEQLFIQWSQLNRQ